MEVVRTSTPDTAFASAARDPVPELEAQRAAFMSEPGAVAMLEAMPGPAMVLSQRRQILAVNQPFLVALGVQAARDLMGLRPGEAVQCRHHDERPGGCGTAPACGQCGAVRAVLDCLATRRKVTHECRLVTRSTHDGGALDLRVHASPASFGGRRFVVVALEDIRAQKRREVLEQTFLHDHMNTCLGLQRITELLSGDVGDATLEAQWRDDLGRLASRAVDEVMSQRHVLAAERGELVPALADVDAREVVQATLDTFRHESIAEQRELRLLASGACRLTTDSVLLGRVTANLVRNALEATPPGGTVSVFCERDRGQLVLSVHNDGVMTPAVQQQVFQRSFSTKAGPGRGLGTYGARLLVERGLGGQVRFESQERLGTLFVVTVPLVRESRRPA